MPRLINRKKNIEDNPSLTKDKNFMRNFKRLNNVLGQTNLSLYGTDRTSEVDALNSKFQSILHDEIGQLTNNSDDDVTSFLNRLWSNDKKATAYSDLMDNQFSGALGADVSTMSSFIYESYRNRLLEQSDLHQVSSQLIELNEAILITRDAIVSADVVEGRMSRTLKFNNVDKDDESDAVPIVETVEKRFKLLEKIKNYIIPKTLEYGEYYMYVIPYAKIFNDFMRKQPQTNRSGKFYREFTLMESVENERTTIFKNDPKVHVNVFMDDAYNRYYEACKRQVGKTVDDKPDKEQFKQDVGNILNNITICNDPVPFPILEEGYYSVEKYMQEFVTESGTNAYTEAKDKKDSTSTNQTNLFQDVNNGVYFQKGNDEKKQDAFDEIRDCYIKLLDPTKVVPVELMNRTIGYYIVMAEDITPMQGMVSSELGYSKFDSRLKEHTVLDIIVDKIIQSFDKDFLKENEKFKETIAEAINYYNLNEKRIKFQFVPAEYMQVFKIDEDENGHGQSMIKKSLFYAKLYLMLLLFKIMSIILYSNDTKVNYIKTSGINKNIANKVQEIARIKQSRQINIMDLFNYTTLINKVGNGSEMYVPTGGSGDRPIETEILSGQDISLNSELLEMLKNAYILATGVPAAIVNYMNEADFAKVIEQNNTKFNGRVVNYQLDFNSSITELYKKILRWSTNLSDSMIDNFEFQLQPPKQTTTNTKAEAVEGFDRLANFVVGLFYDVDNSAQDPNSPIAKEIKEFKKLLAEDQLPMLDMEKLEEMKKQAKLNVKQKQFSPDPSNGNDGDDIGLEDLGAMGGLG